MSVATLPELLPPGGKGGLGAVLRERYLLRLLVRRELKARYKGSLLGLGWSYVRPAVNFGVYYYLVGGFLGLNKLLEAFPIYLFAGMVMVNLFTETLHSATRAVTGNAPLVRKVFLPRELFPVASLLVSLVHFVPGLLILLGGAISYGWRPTPVALAAGVTGLVIVVLLGTGLGLMCAALNVFYRDLEQVVDVLMIVITWSVPMIYPWTQVRDHAPGWVLTTYLANPLVSAVSLFQRAFWWPATRHDFTFPDHMWERAGVALLVSAGVLVLGQLLFARMQKRFAQEL